MSLFIYPLFLAALAAVLLPVIAHLFLRPRAKVVRFPMLRFLAATRVDQRNWRRLKDLLLLLLRAAIVVLIVLMFAQPFLAGGGDGPQHLVLVLDDTLSMDYRSGQGACFAEAVAQAASLLGRMGLADRASIVSLTGRAGSAIGLERGAALDHLRRLETAPLAADPAGVLARAADAAQAVGPGLQQGLFVISDLQKNFWGRLGPAEPERTGLLDYVRAVKAGPGDRPNQALAEASAGQDAQGAIVRARIVNYAETETRATVEARHQALSLGRTNVVLAPRASQTVEFPLRRPEGLEGALPVEVAIETGDGLEADNRFRLILPAEGKAAPRALIVETAPGGGYFIGKAVESLGQAPGGRPFGVEVVAAGKLADRLEARAPGAYPIAVFQGLKGTAPELAAALRSLLDDGGVALVFLSAELDLQVAGKLFADGLLPLKPLAFERKDRPLAGVDRADAFTRDLAASPRAEFMSYGAFAVTAAPAARVSAWLEGGVPLVAALEVGNGHCVMVNTSADAEMSDFVKTSLWLPLVNAALRPGLPEAAQPRRAGERLRLGLAPGAATLKIVTPSGRVRELKADPSGKEAVLEADEAGFYRDADGQPLAAVNPPPEESDLQSFSEDEAEARLRERCRLSDKPREVTRTGQSLEGKLPLWRWLGLAAMVLLAGELFLANRMKR